MGGRSVAAYWTERGFVAPPTANASRSVVHQVLVRLSSGGPALAYPANRVYRKKARLSFAGAIFNAGFQLPEPPARTALTPPTLRTGEVADRPDSLVAPFSFRRVASLRNALVARDGCVLVSADYSQIEASTSVRRPPRLATSEASLML